MTCIRSRTRRTPGPRRPCPDPGFPGQGNWLAEFPIWRARYAVDFDRASCEPARDQRALAERGRAEIVIADRKHPGSRPSQALSAQAQTAADDADRLIRSHRLIEAYNHIHELIAEDLPLPRILDAIVASIETHDPELYPSFLLLDAETGTLHHGAASRLPESYLVAIDGQSIGPRRGSCGAAAFTGQEVISHDLRTDTRWDDYRELIEPLGLLHCWSFPVIGSDGTVFGTFGVYGRLPRSPGADDRRFLRDAAKLAAIAIERRRSLDRLVFDATHDSLTGLSNRAAAFAGLGAMLADTTSRRGSVAVLFLDLDRLKLVNDSLGHDVGDRMISEAAQRLQSCVGPGELVARLGGEEFVIATVGDRGDAVELAECALAALRAPLAGLAAGSALTITASIGIAVIAEPGVDAPEALRRADAAMYAAKARGGNVYAWSSEIDPLTAGRRLLIETALRRAIDGEELRLVYQPLQSFADGHTVGVEALLRWTDPELGVVEPDEFVPIAEQTGLIGEIGAWVLTMACATLPELAAEYGEGIQVGVNVSAQQLRDPSLPVLFARTLAAHGLRADRLIVEITETALLGSGPVTDEIMRALTGMGAHLAVDDFGTGYSSPANLKRYPISAIKIDRSFTQGLPDDPDDVAIVTALVGMGRGLGLDVVVEGIDTQDQYDLLRELGCDYAQGFLLGRPAPARRGVGTG